MRVAGALTAPGGPPPQRAAAGADCVERAPGLALAGSGRATCAARWPHSEQLKPGSAARRGRPPARDGSTAVAGRMARTVMRHDSDARRTPDSHCAAARSRCRSRPGAARRLVSPTAPSSSAAARPSGILGAGLAASSPCPSSHMGVGCGGRISIVGRSVDRSSGKLDRDVQVSAPAFSKENVIGMRHARRARSCGEAVDGHAGAGGAREVGEVLRRDGRRRRG